MGRSSSLLRHSLAGRCGRCVAALFVLLQLTDLAACVPTDSQRSTIDLALFKRNIIKGLKIEKLPDMAQVDISNDEFHSKYLEYFRRMYADDTAVINDTDRGYRGDRATMTASVYDNYPYGDDDYDITGVQLLGRTVYGVDGSPVPLPEDLNIREGNELRATITFPIGRVIANDDGPATVIRSVVRIYGRQLWGSGSRVDFSDGSGDGSSSRDISGEDESSLEYNVYMPVPAVVPVRVYGRRVSSNGASREKPSLVAILTFPSIDRGRWKDVDVTRLLKARKRYAAGGAEELTSLELSLWHPAAPESIQINRDENSHRFPVIHCFLDGNLDDETRRKKRDSSGGNGVRRQNNKRRRPSASKNARQTDCKTDAPSAASTNNGTTNKCCRESMYVEFAQIPGFDFIIEPKLFDAGLCRGRCPAKYNPATRHAYIQSLLWKQHNNRDAAADAVGNRRQLRRVRHGGERSSREDGTAGSQENYRRSSPPPKPCCAPSNLDRLEILHLDELNPNSLKVTTWLDMSVVNCACS